MTSHGGGRLDVLVAGAGPTGLTLALSAHDHGARVRIVDRRPDECRHSRAFLVQPRTLEVLRPYGLAEDLVVHAAPARVHLHLHGRCLPVDAGRLRLPGTAFPRFLLVRQGEVELFLRRALRARGVEVEWGTNLHSIRTGDDGVVGVGTRDGCPTRIGSRFLAGCDGTASTVRRAAGISWNGAAYPQKILLADIELDGDLHPGVAHTRSTAPVCCFCSPWVMWPRGGCSPHSLRTAHPPRANVAMCSSFSTRPSCPPMSPRWHGRSGFR